MPCATRYSSVAPSSATKAAARPLTAAPTATTLFFDQLCKALSESFLNLTTFRVALIMLSSICAPLFFAFFAA
ncbi:hypothetical protein [Agathobaculum sp.]|uniref:hypothetical protein n=1 Tax=Agathobaculum sp. TaxID=2048138 RepID=UPI00307B6FFE